METRCWLDSVPLSGHQELSKPGSTRKGPSGDPVLWDGVGNGPVLQRAPLFLLEEGEMRLSLLPGQPFPLVAPGPSAPLACRGLC